MAIVVLNRVAANNAFSSALCRDLMIAVNDVAAQDDYRAIVLTSAAAHFSVGADLKERSALTEDGLLKARAVSVRLTRTILCCPLPIIAAVHGFTLGGGLELALASDLIVGHPAAVFGLPESRIGIVPGGGGTQLLARRVGWGAAVEMTLTGRRVSADEARSLGLIDRTPRLEPVEDSAVRLATEISNRNPRSVRLIRDAMRAGIGLDLDAALRIEGAAWQDAALSADYAEGLSAFIEKRPPVWDQSVTQT